MLTEEIKELETPFLLPSLWNLFSHIFLFFMHQIVWCIEARSMYGKKYWLRGQIIEKKILKVFYPLNPRTRFYNQGIHTNRFVELRHKLVASNIIVSVYQIYTPAISNPHLLERD